MTTRGVHFAITTAQAERLLAARDEETVVEIVEEEIEEEWEAAYETDKAWDALHRCLSNGTLDPAAGEPPLNRVFFGGRMLTEGDDYVVVLATPAEVQTLAAALANVTEAWLRARYFDVPFPDYPDPKSEEDWAYTYSHFQGLPAFYARAAREGRHVIFTVDQ